MPVDYVSYHWKIVYYVNKNRHHGRRRHEHRTSETCPNQVLHQVSFAKEALMHASPYAQWQDLAVEIDFYTLNTGHHLGTRSREILKVHSSINIATASQVVEPSTGHMPFNGL